MRDRLYVHRESLSALKNDLKQDQLDWSAPPFIPFASQDWFQATGTVTGLAVPSRVDGWIKGGTVKALKIFRLLKV